MEINWFTVIAQIVNFLILVWLLKRFLYKPVLNAIDDRETKISAQLSDAAELKEAAEKEKKLFAQKNELFEKERSDKMNVAVEEINAEKEVLFEDVRKQSEAIRVKYELSLKEQEKNLREMLRRNTTREVFAIAGKTLEDLADARLEEQVVTLFIRKIRGLDEKQNQELLDAFGGGQKRVTIRSAFELQENSRKELETVLKEITGQKNNFNYLTEPELVGGIEIETETYQLSWNIRAYLDSLKTTINTTENQHALL